MTKKGVADVWPVRSLRGAQEWVVNPLDQGPLSRVRLVCRSIYLRGGRKMIEHGPGLTTGCSCRIETHSDGPTLHIERNGKMNDHVHISAWESMAIGDNVLMSPNILITDNGHGGYCGGVSQCPSVGPRRQNRRNESYENWEQHLNRGVYFGPSPLNYGKQYGSGTELCHDARCNAQCHGRQLSRKGD